MNDLMKAVDDRTNLAGTNRLEVLMFRLEDDAGNEEAEVYGINVFKVRELMEIPEIIKMPGGQGSCMVGLANIRGKSVPIIDLKRYCGIKNPEPAKILVVTEYNTSVQGFLVHDVDNIIQLAWSEIREPPEMLANNRGNILTAISRLQDNRMLLILDVEKVLAEVLGSAPITVEEVVKKTDKKDRMIFFADDSAVARAQVAKILDNMEIPHQHAKNGRQALDALKKMADEADEAGRPLHEVLQAIVTDVEMPEMDGYVLTRNLKEDERFIDIPVMMHSSLSSDGNKRLGKKVGADAYVAKLQPGEFSETLIALIEKADESRLETA